MIYSKTLRVVFVTIVSAPLIFAFPDAFELLEPKNILSDNSPLITSNHSLLRRQTSSNSHPDYTCGPDRPCQNKACCGKSNVCGFGDLYCGNGCQSHCDAKAECGRDAATPGTECPLNVCCSQFGFCGTTSEFCDTGCQSNCGQPSKPGLGTDARNKIIGYWESWRADGVSCGAMPPESIPVEALDQLNLAFIYVDPVSYKLMPMDGDSITKLYERVADTKLRNPNLKVWISVGGWSFNDPGTYRSVFGAIAGDSRLSAEFAQNCVDFMNQYGFDGVDIDWEYPGAEDRGGTLSDITNFPRMLEILQKRFKTVQAKGLASLSRFQRLIGKSAYDHEASSWHGFQNQTGTTFSMYLRWFDLPKIAEQIDEFNLMTYDLHGIWDRTDPIGPYVWAHTNLTEIDLALDLFWRNDIGSRSINLGLGFYGRTFKLKDSLCSEPGCEFTGPGDEGACTKSAGILSYKEIRDLLDENSLFDSARYDEDAGVYYVTYGDGGQSWVSFDDAASFQAKVDLANSRGIGGLFIWALDQDDAHLDALRAVSGRDVVVPPLGSGTFGGFDIDKCYITDCGSDCQTGDTVMTHLNQDESGRGCDGKNHNQRSFCCPPNSAPDPGTCYWTGGPVNCHGQCSSGEVSMVLDDWGDSKKRCTNGGKKVWCCPATNGQAVIKKCGLVSGRKCPSDRPQELTYVYDYISGLFDAIEVDQTFCCPAEPKFDNCNWFGDNYYCNDNECPLGQVELFRHNGYHGLPGKKEQMCNKGRQQAFCCDPPFTDGSPFLPVPLENLFPDASSFPTDYDPVFAEAFDPNKDLVPEISYTQDPNKESFAWIIMVGSTTDVQSFEKRDGSHLELFDCPDTHPDDFSVQRAKAICLTDSTDNDCEDIMQGGVEGTVVKLPAHCGPDQWVRAVKYEESSDKQLPPHLVKRAKPHHKIYDFHYDYDFRNLRRDGGEVHVRIDASNHPGYWNEVVSRPAGSPVKRDASSWRDIDRRSFSENDSSDWKNRFDNLLKEGHVGLKKHYEFDQCLFEASATCSSGSAHANAFASGEFNTTMDFGLSLIGTLRSFTFTEAFSYFRQEDFEARVQAAIQAKAKLRFDSGFHPVGTFDAFGSNYNIKGILTINPYFSVAARVQAEATVSAQATVELALKHERFQYYLPTTLGTLPTQPGGNFQVTARNGPISTLGDISASVGGDIIVSIAPTIGFDIELAFGGKRLVDTSVQLTSQADVDFGIAATVGSKCSGLQLDIKGQFQAQLLVKNALPGWKSGTYEIEQATPKTIYSDCISWTAAKRDLAENASDASLSHDRLMARQTLGDNLPQPARSGTCAFRVKGVYCTEDSQNDKIKGCNVYDLPDPSSGGDDSTLTKRDGDDAVFLSLVDSFFDKVLHSNHPLHRHAHRKRAEITDLGGVTHKLEKRGGKVSRYYCNPRSSGHYYVGDLDGVSSASRSEAVYEGFPDSNKVYERYPDASAFTFDDPEDCNNYKIKKMKASDVSDTSAYAAEHVLENQMFVNFMDNQARMYSSLKKATTNSGSAVNPNAKTFINPLTGKSGETIAWCPYMKAWWAQGTRIGYAGDVSANNLVAASYPANNNYETELLLLDGKLNSAVKQAWFVMNQLSWEQDMPKWIADRNWEKSLEALKAHIVTWKYYLDPEVTEILVKQTNRVADNLEKMETDYIPNTIRHATNARSGADIFERAYEYQGLSTAWRTFIKDQHIIVQSRVRTFLKKWAYQMYDLNRPNLQADTAIVEYMENLVTEVNKLEAWDIAWKASTS